MKNQNEWKETKFLLTDNNKLRANKCFLGSKANSLIPIESVARLYGQHIPQFAKGHLLDLGCGMCPLYSLYKPYVTSITCADWDNSFHPNPYLDLNCDISQSIPFKNSFFDTIILSDVLEHIPNPRQLLTETFRVLDTGGVLLLNVPFLYWLHEVPYDYYRYTEYAIRLHLEAAGFQIKVLEIVGGIIESWADLTSKLLAYAPGLSLLVPGLFYSIFGLRRLPWVNQKTFYLDKLFPTGYFVVAKKP